MNNDVKCTIEERDKILEGLWEQLSDIPIDPETERIEESFLGFAQGTHWEEIWHWFDERYSKGVVHLLYRCDGVDRTDQIAKMAYLNGLCPECGTESCVFFHNGECRLPFVYEREPDIREDEGCMDYIYAEGGSQTC